jgi:Ni,Fe-hydrogenase I large subunit
METGALARVLVAYVEGRPEVRDGVDAMVSKLRLSPDALFSTLGRMLARAIEASVLVGQLELWIDAIRANIARGDLALIDLSGWDPSTWPSVARGVSLGEGPRGAVGHWVTIRDGAVAEYQVVDGTTWNASPRDATGQRGPIEEALIGIAVADTDQPIEVLRTVRGFDPCPACGVQ